MVIENEKTIKRIKQNALMIKLGAQICAWCGKNISFPYTVNRLGPSDTSWVPEVPKNSFICSVNCHHDFTDLARARCLHWLNDL